MIHALYLVERLCQLGLSFTFKGGTSLSLITNRLDRLSIDVDVEVHADCTNEDVEAVLRSLVTTGDVFQEWEHNHRRHDVVGSRHYKVYYEQRADHSLVRTELVVLDVVRTSVREQNVEVRVLDHSILEQDGESVHVVMPTVEGLLGDKLTACAAMTVGVPLVLPAVPGMEDRGNKYLEMVKQLYDVNLLIPLVEDWNAVATAFHRTIEVQREVFGHHYSIEEVVNDLVDRALAMFGQLGSEYHSYLITAHQQGHRSLSNYLVDRSAFGYEDVRMAALRAAYISSCVMNHGNPMTAFSSITESSLNAQDIRTICKGIPKPLRSEAVALVEALHCR